MTTTRTRAIGLAAACLLFLCCTAARAQTDPPYKCPKRPPAQNAELVIRSSGSAAADTVVESGAKTAFNRRLTFCLGLKRDGEKSLPGFVVIKVVRVYAPGQTASARDGRETLLYRGAPDTGTPFQGQVRRDLYEKYHNGEIEHPVLRHKFHAKQGPIVTNGTALLKRKYVFDTGSIEPRGMLQRTYILQYRGVAEAGSWVPFEVNADPQFQKVQVWAFDLGEVGSTEQPYEHAWTIERG